MSKIYKQEKNLLGQVFGELTVISRSEIKGKDGCTRWNCVCSCGKIKTTSCGLLNSGKTKSCGHLRNLVHNRNEDRKNATEKNLYATMIVRRSKIIDMEYNLDYDKFLKLIYSNCYYCGECGTNKWKDRELKNLGEKEPFFIIYNGIDRVDNSIGYTNENCVPCCRFCNAAKMDRTKEEFCLWIERIYGKLKQWKN